MRDPLEILELRAAVAGASPEVVRQVLDDLLPGVAAPSTGVEYDAWMWALYDLGLAAEALPDYERALELYAGSIDCNRTSELMRSAALIRSGLCLEQLGRWAEAITAYRQAGDGAKGWPECQALRLWRLGRLLRAAEDSEEACGVLGRLMEMLPQPGIPELEAALEYAACLEGLGRNDEAVAILAAHVDQDHPCNIEARVRLASLQLRLGNDREAAEVLRSVATHAAADSAVRAAASLRIRQIQKD